MLIFIMKYPFYKLHFVVGRMKVIKMYFVIHQAGENKWKLNIIFKENSLVDLKFFY